MKRFGLVVLAYLIPTFALGYLWHLILFEEYYDTLQIYRENLMVPFGFLAILVQGTLFAWIFGKAFGKDAESFGSRALSYGALGALLSWTFTTLAVAAKHRMASVPDFLLIETAFTIVQWGIVAPVTVLGFDLIKAGSRARA